MIDGPLALLAGPSGLSGQAHNYGTARAGHHGNTHINICKLHTPSQPQLPGLILQLTFRTHYLTRESAQEITYMQSVTLIDAS